MKRIAITTAVAVAASVCAIATSSAATDELPQPHHLAAASQNAKVVTAARRYAAFWNTGDASYAQAALAPDFIDRTLPAGRPQGPTGPLAASQAFRKAVPDLRAEIEEMV